MNIALIFNLKVCKKYLELRLGIKQNNSKMNVNVNNNLYLDEDEMDLVVQAQTRLNMDVDAEVEAEVELGENANALTTPPRARRGGVPAAPARAPVPVRVRVGGRGGRPVRVQAQQRFVQVQALLHAEFFAADENLNINLQPRMNANLVPDFMREQVGALNAFRGA